MAIEKTNIDYTGSKIFMG